MTKSYLFSSLLVICALCYANIISAQDYRTVGVHDPSIMHASDGMYYITGSHMAGAKSPDLINWEQLSSNVNDQKFFPNLKEDLGPLQDWANTNTFWAAGFIQLKNGKYMMNYCVCQGSCPQGAIGYALADNPEGPYKDMGVLVRSFGSRGDWEDEEILAKLQAAERGDTSSWVSVTVDEGPTVSYNSNFMPNAIDPAVFYDGDGRLWMLYGSFSGGIFVLELNQDGSLKEGQDYYGTKLMGNYHSRFEGPFMLYSPESDYYYMFLSFGGLSANQGYNIRVMRSENPDGIFYDAAGNSMLDAMGIPGQTLNRQDKLIEKYGLKMMGNFVFNPFGDETNASEAYRSPGHNSAYYNPETGQYFLIFHTRFEGTGDRFQVRVHEMFMNEDDWLVAAPHRYTGEINGDYTKSACAGTYKMVNHGTAITQDIVASVIIQLKDDNTVSGALKGSWSMSNEDDHMVTMNLDGETYKGVFHYQNDPANDADKMTFTICGSDSNVTIWGSKAE